MFGLWPVTTKTLVTPLSALASAGRSSQLGNDRFRVLAQNLTGFIGVANNAERRVPELLELFDNGAACVRQSHERRQSWYPPGFVSVHFLATRATD